MKVLHELRRISIDKHKSNSLLCRKSFDSKQKLSTVNCHYGGHVFSENTKFDISVDDVKS